MTVTKVALVVGLILSMLLIIPACASAASGGSIGGKIDFPAVSTYPENLTMENLTVKDLTIYAVNVQTGFANVTNPNADGTYEVSVPDYGLYQIFVNPDAVADTSRGQDLPQIVQYPNKEGTRLYVVDVYSSNVTVADIKGYAPGFYQPPNSLTLTSETSAEATVPTPQATATPAPGFLSLVTLAGMIIAAAAFVQRKN